jgi:hypothetical protein
MRCIASRELDEKDLLLYLDSLADHATVSHLEQCTYCHERAETLAHLQERVKTCIYRINCPTSIELGEYHLHMLPAPQRLVIAQHLRECHHCAREIAQLESFMGQPLPTPQGGWYAQTRLLVARLAGLGLGSENRPSPALRGEGRPPMTLEADGIAIVLDVQATGIGRLTIFGQLAAADQDLWTDASVEFRQDGQLESMTVVDDLGTFHFKDVLPGQKELWIISKSNPVVIVSDFEISV